MATLDVAHAASAIAELLTGVGHSVHIVGRRTRERAARAGDRVGPMTGTAIDGLDAIIARFEIAAPDTVDSHQLLRRFDTKLSHPDIPSSHMRPALRALERLQT